VQASDDRLVHFVKRFLDPTVARRFLMAVDGKLEYAPRQRIQSLQNARGLSLLDLLGADLTGVRGLGAPVSPAPADTDGGESHSASSSSGRCSNGPSSQQTSPTSGGNGQRGKSGRNDESNGSSNPTKDVSTEGRSTSQRTRLRCPFHAFFPEVYCASHDTKFKSCQGPGWLTMQYLK
jgi:hypothetical protein